MGFWGQSPKTWDKGKNDPVTEADLAVDRHLKDALLDARPDYGWLSEETPDTTDRLTSKTIFVVDPIDGTRSFIDGQKTWAHSLAVVKQGVVVAGAVYLPASDQLYAASIDKGATCNGRQIRVSNRRELAGATIFANKATFDASHWVVPPEDLIRKFRPSLAYRLAACGEGKADAMITFRDSWEWDIAAGALIAQEAGATVTDRDGNPLVFNSAEAKTPGALVAAPALHSELLQRRSPA